MTVPMKLCKDCVTEGISTKRIRPAPYPGPRCATHHRAVRKQRSERAHDASVARRYSLAPGDYRRLYEAQRGLCAGCGERTGRNGTRGRRLAVDHDHVTGQVRGLLCSTCNQQIGDQRDDPLTFFRLALYLANPPALSVLGNIVE
jgi:hypothetical protein